MVELASQQHAATPSPAWSTAPAMQATDESFLAADVGGTHARVGLVLPTADAFPPLRMLQFHRYRCAEWSGLGAILDDFRSHRLDPAQHVAGTPLRAVVACAGRVLDDAIVNENLPWPVSIRALREQAGLAELAVINDFEAVARAVRFLGADDTRPVIDVPPPAPAGPLLVLGPGTGLGSAVLLPGADGYQVLPTEAGQISLAPGNEREIEILRVLGRDGRRASYEAVLSGPGLVNLYRALCVLRGVAAVLPTPAQITDAALAERDAAAVETLQVFCALLGSFVGDMAMLYATSGGVFLAGGILPRIHDFLCASRFAERFLDKGVMRAFLQQIPVRLIEHGQLGVIGAANWFLETRPRPTAA